MKWIEILKNEKLGLLQSESDTQYVVAIGYDPNSPEGQQWSYGDYYPYWNDKEKKSLMLSAALEKFRCLSEKNYISKMRLEEIATASLCKLNDGMDSEEFREFIEDELDLDNNERDFFELNEFDDFEDFDIYDEMFEEE